MFRAKKEIVMIIHRLYANKQEAQERIKKKPRRIKKIKEIGYSRAPKLWDKVDRMYKYKQKGTKIRRRRMLMTLTNDADRIENQTTV